MFNKLKQFKDLRDQAKQLQNTLSHESAKGSSGSVEVTINGNQEITAVVIQDTGLTDKTALEKDMMNATNKAIKNVQKIMALKMREMGDFDISKMLGGSGQ